MPALVKTTTSGRKIIAIDACPLHCAKHCPTWHNVSPAVHLDLIEYGVKKRYHRDYDPDEAEQVWRKILGEVKKLKIESRSRDDFVAPSGNPKQQIQRLTTERLLAANSLPNPP